MKAVLSLLGLAAIVCLMPSAHASDVSGAWKGAFDFNGESVPVTLNLKVADAAVTGTVEGLPTSPVDIHEGKIDGDAITFWVNTDYQGQTYKLVFKGKITADQIDFSFGTDDGSWGTTLTAKRGDAGAPATPATPAAPAAPALPVVTGVWKGSFDFNGNSMPVTFNLTSSGATLTGTVEGMGPAPVNIHDGEVDADGISFSIDVDYQGQTYTLAYKGKVTAGQIDFSFGTTDGSWGSTVSAKKS
jgi:hypothetical protein